MLKRILCQSSLIQGTQDILHIIFLFLHIIFSSNLVKQLSLDADRNLLCSVGEDNVIKLWRADTFFNAIRDVRWSETDGSLSIV